MFLCFRAVFPFLILVGGRGEDAACHFSAGDPSSLTDSDAPRIPDEQRLLKYLMNGYDRNVRPVYRSADAVNVSLGFSLTQIFDVDEKNQLITTNIWLDQTWHDEKLRWNPDDFHGIKKLRLPCTKIWLPDIVLYNSADDYTGGYMESLAMVDHNGSVFWPPIVKFRSTCQIDITYYPFDDQVCSLKMGSWAYDGNQLNLFSQNAEIDLRNYVKNGEWDLVNQTAVRNVLKYPCCPEPFPDVTFYVHIRRRTLYYMYNVFGPCVMLSVLTVLIFWMRPDSGEKITLGLTVLLAFSVFMLLIAEKMPATSSFVPLISLYFISTMSLTCISVVVAVIVSNISHRGNTEQHLPRWFRLLIQTLAKIVHMKLYFIKDPSYYKRQPTIYKLATESRDSGYPLAEHDEYTEEKENRIAGAHCSKWIPVFREISQKLDVIVDKGNDRVQGDTIMRQWQEAGEVVDRFLFWVFFTFNVLSSIFLLGILPTMKHVTIAVPAINNVST